MKKDSSQYEEAGRLRRIQSVSDAALAHVELDDLFAELLVRIRDALEADTCAILLLDEEAGELVARAARGIEEEVERGTRIPLGKGFAGRIAAERRPIVVEDVSRADVLNPVLREKGIASLLGVPLVARGSVLGVLHVGTLRKRSFTEADVELLTLAGERAAVAIDRARAYETERKAADRLRKLHAVTEAALRPGTLDELFNELLERVRALLAADTCAILVLDERRGELVARAARGLEEAVERGTRIPLGKGFAGRIAADARPVVIDDVDHAHVLNPVLREKGVRSLLGAPLRARGRVLGVIHVGTLTPRQFTSDDATLLEVAAEHAALGLEKLLLQERLMQLDQVRHRFISIASHELRTPAAAILGAAVTLARPDVVLDAQDETQLKQILAEQAHRLATLIEQLLDVSRLDARAVEVKAEKVKVRESLERLVGSLAAPNGADIRVCADAALEPEVDPIALERIVTNLVTNALKYGAPPVLVGAEAVDGRLVVTVEDNGPGVDDEVRPRLFDQFTRGRNAERTQGSGLGLAIAKAYAEAHGGELEYSRGSRGARFTLALPSVPPTRTGREGDAG